MRVYTLFFTILFSLHSLAQDKVELKDGSFINGQVTSVRPTSVSVKTKFAGTIKILTKEIYLTLEKNLANKKEMKSNL